MTMASLILIPIIFGVILYKIPLKIGKVFLMFIQLFLSVNAANLFLRSRSGEVVHEILGGTDPILYIGLRGDRIALVFVCLTIFLFTMAFIYSIRDKFFDKKFMLLFLILEGVLIGIFLTDDIFNLFVLLEVSTVVITILIMFKKDKRSIYDGLFYLIIQIISMMFFLFGIAYLYKIFGVLSIGEITNLIARGVPRETLILPFAFLMTGVCLKIGFFPLFSWVPRSYGTPSTPIVVVAILSGLFVKSSLYLFIRLNHIFYPTLDYREFFLVMAVLSGLIGFIKALSQKNIKLLLAYSTISQVGLIAVSSLISSEMAYWGGIYHILNHAILKSMLFLATGMVIDQYNTANVNEIRGLLKKMPFVSVAILFGFLGITGAPLFNGSISKYWIVGGTDTLAIESIIWIINTGTLLTYIKYASILFGDSEVKPKTDPLKAGVVLFLSIACLLGGIFGRQIVYFLYDIDLYIGISSYLNKGVIYFVQLVIGIIFYKYVISKSKALDQLGEGSLTLPQSCFILLMFFTSLIAYGIMF